jgi:hypothetical protein
LYHTYQLNIERAQRIVGLYHTSPPDNRKQDIKKLGFKVRAVPNAIHKRTKTPLPIFFIDLEPSPENKKNILRPEEECLRKTRELLSGRDHIEPPTSPVAVKAVREGKVLAKQVVKEHVVEGVTTVDLISLQGGS